MGNNPNGRRSKWKITSMEYHLAKISQAQAWSLNGRQPPQKTRSCFLQIFLQPFVACLNLKKIISHILTLFHFFLLLTTVIHVAQFLQYELWWIKAVLERLTAQQFVYARTHADPPVPVCSLYTSVASSSDSLISASHQADVMLAPGSQSLLSLQLAWIVCVGWGGIGLIIMSKLNLRWVKLMLGWVVTIC